MIVEALGEQYEVIEKHKDKIPQIEMDIVMGNIRRLYECFYDLNRLNSGQSVKSIEDIKPEIPKEMVDEKMVEPIIEKSEPDIFIPEEEVIPEKVMEEKKEAFTPEIMQFEPEEPVIETSEPVDIWDVEEPKPVVVPEKEKPAEPPTKPVKPGKKESVDLFSLAEKEIVADKFKEPQKSIHDKIATEKTDKTMADKIGKTSIGNLKTAIGINDKFLFINELFKGDIQEYNKTIDKLNSYSSLEETTIFLEEQKEKYRWSEKPDAYQKLEDLIIRKFL